MCPLTFPFRYKKTNTKRLAKIISILIWVKITFIYVPFYIKTRSSPRSSTFILQPCLHCTSADKRQTVKIIIIFVSFFLLWVLTLLTLVSLKNNYEKSKNLNRIAQKDFAAEKQMSVILILMVFAFTFSLLPTMYNYFYSTFFKNKVGNKRIRVYYLVDSLIYASFLATNSIWNIVIYNVFNKNFRVALTKLFKATFKCFY